jgi:prephenate dehydrogenase
MAAAILDVMHLGFVGFGLIGGSIARAVRASGDGSSWTISAWSPTGGGPALAAADGIIDRFAPTAADAIGDADLIVLAGPPTACLAAIDDLVGPWRASLPPGAVITDVASTKGAILARADAAGLRFVGGHPMAGLEVSGYEAGRADLFVGRSGVIVPGRVASPADVGRVRSVAEVCGARPVELAAAVHDRAVAAISHQPMLLATALVEAVAGTTAASAPDTWSVAAGLAASGWRDMTRLARGDPAMGAGIAVTNGEALVEQLRALETTLARWREELERPGGPDEPSIRKRLAATRARLEEGT